MYQLRKGFANSASSQLNAGASKLSLPWPLSFSNANLACDHLISYFIYPFLGLEGTHTGCRKSQAVFYEGAVRLLYLL